LDVKSGILSVFAIAGPGFMHEEVEEIGGTYHDLDIYRSIAFDFGGGIEVVPHRRWSLRLDLTDFYAGQKFVRTDSLRTGTSYTPPFSPRFWDHHLDFKSGVMFRF
jgi:hypothetical protein